MDDAHRKRILSKLEDMMRYVEELKMMLPSKRRLSFGFNNKKSM